MDELRLALRRVFARPGVAAASVLTLAAAIGAAAAAYSLIAAVLLRPLPVKAPDRLMVVGTTVTAGPAAGTLDDNFLYPDYPQIRDGGVFEHVTAEWGRPLALLTNTGGGPAEAAVAFASYDFFDTLGIDVPIGRTFGSRDDQRGAPIVAILADRYWRRALNADPGVLGKTIAIAGKPATIVGVAAHGFRGLNLAAAPDLYLPLHVIGDVGGPYVNFLADSNHQNSPTAGLKIIGLLPPHVLPAQAAAGLSGLVGSPGGRAARSLGMTPIDVAAIASVARAGTSEFTRLLMLTVGLLLLIGCGTVGMLLLVRTEARRNEFALCLALGASRTRLARGIALEGACLSAAGGVLAVPIAWWLFAGIRMFQLPGGVEIEQLDLRLDARAVALTAGAAVLGALLITLVAGVFGFPADAGDALRSRAGATPRRTRRLTRAVLVVGQVAVALVLLAGAGVLARSTMAALRLNPGFDTANLVGGAVSLDRSGYTPARADAFFDGLIARLQGNPAIRSASLNETRGGMSGTLTIDGVPHRLPSTVGFTAVDGQYFRTLGAPIVSGRGFTANDSEHAPPVGIASVSFARLLAQGGNPIGHRITMPFRYPPAPAPVIEIVGVVPDLITSVTTLEPLLLYLPLAQQRPSTNGAVLVRASGDPDAARREILSAIKGIDPAVASGPLLTIEDRLARQMSAQRFGTAVLGALGTMAALLTLLGTYVLAESMAALRMREMGIRAALGATRGHLGAIVLAETGRLVGLGLAAGLIMAWAGAGVIRAFMFRVEPLDPMTLATVSAAILTLALAVSLRPALRAARVDLGRVLKED
ncbi:MAG: ABC transporter permease [Acidobacteriota bacterium]